MRTSAGSLYYKGPPWDKWGTFHGLSRWHGSTISVLRFGSWQFYCDFLEVCPYFKERFYLNIWGAGEWTEHPVGNYFQMAQEKTVYLYWTCNFPMTITITTVAIMTAKEELVQEVRQRQQLNTAWSRVLLGLWLPRIQSQLHSVRCVLATLDKSWTLQALVFLSLKRDTSTRLRAHTAAGTQWALLS